MVKKSDLPFGSEFSPSQVELSVVLEFVEESAGDWRKLESLILQQYFSTHGKTGEDKEGKYNREKLANNCKLGLIAYGLIERDGAFTAFGRSLYDVRQSEQDLYRKLARHILLNLHGMNLVSCILDMTAAGEEINLTTLRDGLADRGIHYPSGGKHPSIMRLWLAKAGVFVGARWQVDEVRVAEILGTTLDDFGVLADFTPEQRAFIRAVANTGVTSPQPANEIARLAAATYGVKFPEKSLPKLVLNRLIEAGYITAEKTTKGRGAKPFQVAPTEKLVAEVIEPLLEQLVSQTDPKLRALLKKPLHVILQDVSSTDRHTAGLALEALGFKIMRLIDMEYVATRLRGVKTGGAEVDLIFQSRRLVFSRWQIQCKNTGRVSLDDVAKEVGLTHFLKSNVVVIISTGDIGSEARRYANAIMRESNLSVVMLACEDLNRIIASPASIVEVFEREARHAMRLKTIDLESDS